MSDIKKLHTTNYFNTFIEVAEDTRALSGTRPPSKGGKETVAGIQYELIAGNPYQYTSDDILFQAYARKNDLTEDEYPQSREEFFSKGQPCLRASPLTKTYGFGIHCNADGKFALFGMETTPYQSLANDPELRKVKAMRTSKKQ
ncbi:MAG: DUF6157 family protein [Arcticibacter sp.]